MCNFGYFVGVVLLIEFGNMCYVVMFGELFGFVFMLDGMVVVVMY